MLGALLQRSDRTSVRLFVCQWDYQKKGSFLRKSDAISVCLLLTGFVQNSQEISDFVNKISDFIQKLTFNREFLETCKILQRSFLSHVFWWIFSNSTKFCNSTDFSKLKNLYTKRLFDRYFFKLC